jgi:hypothetical protein
MLAQQNAGLAGMSMPQTGPQPGPSGPMGIPLGGNAAHLGLGNGNGAGAGGMPVGAGAGTGGGLGQ